MNPLPKMTSDLHRVGGGYSVQFDTRSGVLRCEWTPSVPSPRDLRRKVDMRKYEAARNAFCAELARRVFPGVKSPAVVIIAEEVKDGE